MASSFDDAIRQHLELQRRNIGLEERLPLARYRGEETSNHSLFKPEADARLEDTQEFVPDWPSRGGNGAALDPWLVRDAPSFDWGD